jgi:hypothetical protein
MARVAQVSFFMWEAALAGDISLSPRQLDFHLFVWEAALAGDKYFYRTFAKK